MKTVQIQLVNIADKSFIKAYYAMRVPRINDYVELTENKIFRVKHVLWSSTHEDRVVCIGHTDNMASMYWRS